jgi:hypothetical protein
MVSLSCPLFLCCSRVQQMLRRLFDLFSFFIYVIYFFGISAFCYILCYHYL